MIVSLALCCSACGTKARENGGGEIRFTDALGREVAVSQNTERVASLLGSFSDVWLSAGGSLCASAEDAWEDFGKCLHGQQCENEGRAGIGGNHRGVF